MKSRPLLNRVRKAAATPTSAERIAMAQGHAAEQQAKVAQGREGEKYPDWRTDLAGFHAALERSHTRYMEKFPRYNPLTQALKAFAAAGPPRPPLRIREGATLTEVLEAFRRLNPIRTKMRGTPDRLSRGSHSMALPAQKKTVRAAVHRKYPDMGGYARAAANPMGAMHERFADLRGIHSQTHAGGYASGGSPSCHGPRNSPGLYDRCSAWAAI